MLKVSELCSGYGDIQILNNISFDVGNEIFAVLGANGAGKTTLLKTLTKLLPVQKHSNENVFADLSVAENLSIGSLTGERSRGEKLEEIYNLFPRLAERTEQLAGSLSGGEGQMLAVARALMQDPKIILLDEPSAGLSPLFVDVLFEKISEIRCNQNVTIVLAEQNVVKTLELADRVLVLSLGETHFVKTAEELNVKQLMEAYHI